MPADSVSAPGPASSQDPPRIAPMTDPAGNGEAPAVEMKPAAPAATDGGWWFFSPCTNNIETGGTRQTTPLRKPNSPIRRLKRNLSRTVTGAEPSSSSCRTAVLSLGHDAGVMEFRVEAEPNALSGRIGSLLASDHRRDENGVARLERRDHTHIDIKRIRNGLQGEVIPPGLQGEAQT